MEIGIIVWKMVIHKILWRFEEGVDLSAAVVVVVLGLGHGVGVGVGVGVVSRQYQYQRVKHCC